MLSSKYKPTITDFISLGFIINSKISPAGDKVAFVKTSPNWNKNQYERLCFVHDVKKDITYQLTRSGITSQIEWINNESLAILKAEFNDNDRGNQIYVFDNMIGEPWKVTNHKKGIQNFKVFGQGLLYLAKDPEKQERKKRKNKFGTYVYFEQEKSESALYFVDLEKMFVYHKDVKNKTEEETKDLVKPIIEISKLLDEPLSIANFVISKQSDAIYLNCKLRDDLVYFSETSNYQIQIDPVKAMESYLTKEKEKKEKKKKDKKETKEKKEEKEDFSYIGKILKIAFPKETNIVAVSPDGGKLLLYMKERDNMFYTIGDYWILNLIEWKDLLNSEEISKKFVKITGDLDRDLYSGNWVNEGIIFSYPDGTKAQIALISDSGELRVLNLEGNIPRLYGGFDVSENGYMCFFASSAKKIIELYITGKPITSMNLELKQITNQNDEVKTWDFGTIETIRWKSKDGTEIEGVLRKPTNYDPQKKYPLAFIIHGGPRAYDPERQKMS